MYQTGVWVKSFGLPEVAQVFEQNEIKGEHLKYIRYVMVPPSQPFDHNGTNTYSKGILQYNYGVIMEDLPRPEYKACIFYDHTTI